MLVSNLIAMAIMISTAATLHQAGVTNIQTAAQAAQALEPVAGHFAFALLSLGIIRTAAEVEVIGSSRMFSNNCMVVWAEVEWWLAMDSGEAEWGGV